MAKNNNYELVEAQEVFGDDNGGMIYGIHWLDRTQAKGHDVVECEWFFTKQARDRALKGK